MVLTFYRKVELYRRVNSEVFLNSWNYAVYGECKSKNGISKTHSVAFRAISAYALFKF